MKYFLLSLWLFISVSLDIHGENMSQWRGPYRNGVYTETNLLKVWNKNGPRLIWSVEGIGKGYSSPVISNSTIYITGMDDSKNEFISAFDLGGRLKWKKGYGSAWNRSFPEARTTPTVEGERVYVISGMGKVVCFNAKTGSEIWSVEAFEKFGGKQGRWGTAESPLIVDNKVIYTPCGDQTTMVALDKYTGKTIWKSKTLNDQSAYASPILIHRNEKKLIVTVTGNYIIGVDPADGDIKWTFDYYKTKKDDKGVAINPNSPVYHNGSIYVTSGYDHGGVKLNLSADLNRVSLAWIDTTLDCHHGGVVVVNGYIYGANWLNNRNGNWVCIDWETGKLMYEKKWHTKGSIIYADGMLYCFEEKDATVALVQATPNDFNIVSSFQAPKGKGPSWAHPVIHDGRLHIRRGDALMVYDIQK